MNSNGTTHFKTVFNETIFYLNTEKLGTFEYQIRVTSVDQSEVMITDLKIFMTECNIDSSGIIAIEPPLQYEIVEELSPDNIPPVLKLPVYSSIS